MNAGDVKLYMEAKFLESVHEKEFYDDVVGATCYKYFKDILGLNFLLFSRIKEFYRKNF